MYTTSHFYEELLEIIDFLHLNVMYNDCDTVHFETIYILTKCKMNKYKYTFCKQNINAKSFEFFCEM